MCVSVCLAVCLSYQQFIRSYIIVGLSKTVSEGTQSLNLKSPSALISETDKSPHSLPPAVAHIDTSLMTLPDSEPSARLSNQPSVTDGGVSGELISRGLSLESSVDPPPLSTYMPSPLSSLTNTSSNVAMTLTGPIGNFSFNSQKLLSPAEFVSSPPHSLSSFSKITPTDFSSALPSVVSNTSVAAPATPTSVAVQTSVAPPPITSAEDSSTEVTLESSSNTDSDDEDDGDDEVTPQEIIQSTEKRLQGISETLDLPQSEINVSKMSAAEVSISDAKFHREAVEGDSNKSVTSQQKQTSEVDGLPSPQQLQKSELLQIEGRVSQASSDFASANDQESEYEDPTINVANNLVDTRPYSKPQSEEVQMTGQPTNANSDAKSTNNNVQFIQCNECSTFNSADVLKCSHCGCVKNDQWTPQNFLKAIASSQNSTEHMMAQSPSTADVVTIANESISAVESSSAVDSNVTPISYTMATLLTAAPDHDRVSVDNGAVTESPRSSVVTLHTSSSLQAATAGVDKDTSQSSDITHLPSSSTSVGGSSYSTNHQWLTRSVM